MKQHLVIAGAILLGASVLGVLRARTPRQRGRRVVNAVSDTGPPLPAPEVPAPSVARARDEEEPLHVRLERQALRAREEALSAKVLRGEDIGCHPLHAAPGMDHTCYNGCGRGTRDACLQRTRVRGYTGGFYDELERRRRPA